MVLDLLCQTSLFPPITNKTTLFEAITPCFAFAVAPLVPITLAILALFFLLVYGSFFPASKLEFTRTVRLKLLVFGTWFICLLIASGLNFWFNFDASGRHLQEQFTFSINLLAFVILFSISIWICIRYGIVSSGFLHLTTLAWLLFTLPLLLWTFNQVLISKNNAVLIANLILFLLNTLSSLVIIGLLCIPDTEKAQNYQRLEEKPVCPFSECSAIENMLFSYAGPLLKKSFSNPLTISADYWELEKRSQASSIARKMKLPKNVSLSRLFLMLCSTSWPQLVLSAFAAVNNVLMRLGYCLFLKWSLRTAMGDFPFWMTVGCAILIVVCDVIRNTTFTQGCLAGYQTFLNVRTALISMVYEKMMRLSPTVQTETPLGIISNHISVDILHTKQFWYELQFFIYSPLMISSAIYFLSKLVGFHNTYQGCIILLGFMTFNICLSRVYKQFEVKQMRFKDDRLRLVTDTLNGIKLIKFYGWENSIQNMISKIRKRELTWLRNSYWIDNMIGTTFNFGPLTATLITFYNYVIVDKNNLTPDVAFIVLVLFAVTRFAIYKLPLLCTNAAMAFVSLKRLQEFFNKEDRPTSHLTQRVDDSDPLVATFRNASFSWSGKDEDSVLRDITLEIKRNQLVAVLGRVGSGKSTLLQALAGELNCAQGNCQIRANSLAYLPQIPWIQNKTLRDNILFDPDANDMNLYSQVLSACALNEDLELLPGGDLTEIGEKGINLSGGQKARVSLARAVYQQAELYVVDDPFSALDQHVGTHIFHSVFGPDGLLKNKTCVVALNALNFLPLFDLIIYLEDGQIKHTGDYESLKHIFNTSTLSIEPPVVKSDQDKPKLEENEDAEIDYLIEVEQLRADRQSAFLFYKYVKAFSVPLFVVYIISLCVLSTVTVALGNLFIAQWVSDPKKEESLGKLETYALFGLTSTFFIGIAYAMQTYGSYHAAQKIHDKTVNAIIRAPMSFFDKTPIGRIINRLSADIERVDTGISHLYAFLFILLSEVIHCTLAMFIAIPWFLVIISPLLIIFVFAVRFFNKASLQYRRITSNSMTAIFNIVNDSFTGASSIRTFKCLDRFRRDFYERLDRNSESQLVEVLTSYFMQIRLDLLTDLVVVFFLLTSAIFIEINWITIGIFAMILNNCVLLCGFLGETADIYRSCETELVAIERLDEYTKLEAEPIWQSTFPTSLPDSWSIEFENVSLRYRETVDPVLHNVSFKVESGERIGIIGRTGAGKTSLTSLLFRLVEPFEGCIRIGGVDIKKMGHDLRKMLTIIPQDPILFTGKMRINLDPFDEFSDEELLRSLEKAHLSSFFANVPNPLEFNVNDGGLNLSVGQRQLVCLARALLRKSKILVLDEATASIDHLTDALIQQIIREEFSSSTILTIAHRVDTILDYDRVLQMDSGRVKAFDKPEVILGRK